ncbi:hypothetical protein C0J50_4080 [Silurus asotus]|uniref:Uncharacterized protein n=1 Tax=Silurus asotus TaxID=30991 RepID=A0AAD5FEB0_SILAS|nr:hypothetical protein C0J50_4080 [Silurus asotus]
MIGHKARTVSRRLVVTRRVLRTVVEGGLETVSPQRERTVESSEDRVERGGGRDQPVCERKVDAGAEEERKESRD